MKHLGYALLVLASLAVPFLLESGCSKLLTQPNYGVPTAVPTGTFTSTRSPTSTATRTFTGTPTATSSPTQTNTPGGPTNTFTQTPTITNTVPPTSTPTTIPGWVFNSPGAISGWNFNNGTAITTGFDASANCGPSTGALAVTIAFTGTGQATNVQYNVGTPIDLSGKTVSYVVSVPSGFTSSGPQGGQIYVQDGAPQSYANIYSSWTNLSSGCVTISMAVPSSITGGFDPTQVQLLGFQINSNGSVASSQMVVDVFYWLYN